MQCTIIKNIKKRKASNRRGGRQPPTKQNGKEKGLHVSCGLLSASTVISAFSLIDKNGHLKLITMLTMYTRVIESGIYLHGPTLFTQRVSFSPGVYCIPNIIFILGNTSSSTEVPSSCKSS